MRHADEGALNALLDGGLSPGEAGALREHLLLCGACRQRLEDARRLRDQADAILAGVVPGDVVAPPFEALVGRAVREGGAVAVPGRRGPVVFRAFAWAAAIAIVIGGGWWIRATMNAGQPSVALQEESGKVARAAATAPAPLPAAAAQTPAAPPAADLSAPAPHAAPMRPEPDTREAGYSGMGAAERDAAPQRVALGKAATPAAGASTPARGEAAQGIAAAAPAPAAAPQADVATEAGRSWSAEGLKVPPPPKIVPPVFQAGKPLLIEHYGQVAAAQSANRATMVTAQNVEAAPTFTPYTVAPELRNRDEVRAALVRFYPPPLKDAGVGGTSLIWVMIDEKGSVLKTQVKQTSGYRLLDSAALRVGQTMLFSPALNRDQPVKVWVSLPIVFKTQ